MDPFIRWGDSANVALTQRLVIGQPPSVVDSPFHEIIRASTVQPHVWRYVVVVDYVGQIWKTETAIVTTEFKVTVGVGSASRQLTIPIASGFPYITASREFEEPASFISVETRSFGNLVQPGKHDLKVTAFTAPIGVVLQAKDLKQ